MNLEEIKNSTNEWVWDRVLNTYFWILNVDKETKIIKAKGLSGLETEIFFSTDRFFKDAKKVGCV